MNTLPENHLIEKAFSLNASNEGLHAGNISFEVGGDDRDSMRQNIKIQKWDRKKETFCICQSRN